MNFTRLVITTFSVIMTFLLLFKLNLALCQLIVMTVGPWKMETKK